MRKPSASTWCSRNAAPGVAGADWSATIVLPPNASGLDQRDQFRPSVQQRQYLVGLGRRQAYGHAGDAEIAVALEQVRVLRRAAQRHRERLGITAGLFGHLSQTRHKLFGAAGAGACGCWD